MNKDLEVRAKLYISGDEDLSGLNGLLKVGGHTYQLVLPESVKEDSVKKIHICSALKSIIETAQNNDGCIDEVVFEYRFN